MNVNTSSAYHMSILYLGLLGNLPGKVDDQIPRKTQGGQQQSGILAVVPIEVMGRVRGGLTCCHESSCKQSIVVVLL